MRAVVSDVMRNCVGGRS